MRKLVIIIYFLLLMASLNAQDKELILNESFDGGSIPSGWTIGELGQSNWSISETKKAGGEKNELMLQHNPTFIGTSRFVSPVIDLNEKNNIVVSFKHYLDNYNGSHTIGIATTSDNGTTWNIGWSESYNIDGKYEVRQLIETPDIGNENVQFCIFYTGNILNVDYWYFDDIMITNLENTDIELNTVDVPNLVIVGNTTIEFTVINKGTSNVNSIEASYQFEGHEPVTQTFETNIASLEAKMLTFTTPTFLEADVYLLTVNILSVNGTPDEDPNNNSVSKEISVNIGLTQRIPMIEHFSSSTCSPCVNVNTLMAALTANNPGKFTYTKYPMNFPGTGDPYYYQEVGVRANYYNVPWVPYLLLDGIEQDGAVTQEAFDQQYNSTSLVEIRGAFVVDGNNIVLSTDIMAYAKLENVKAYVSVNEKTTTENTGTNGETEFHHIVMKMLDNASGNNITINAGEYQRLSFNVDLSSTFVEDMNDLEIAVWLQDDATKSIYNSHYLYEYSSHPYPVENLQLTVNDVNTITAVWNAPSEGNPSGYNIYVNSNLVEENTTNLNYTFTPTVGGYCVVEVCAVYGGEKTSIKAVKGMQIELSVEENQQESFKMYPNPADNHVIIISENDIQRIDIYNIVGKLIRSITYNEKNINLNISDLSPGIYFINANQANGIISTQKLMVTH